MTDHEAAFLERQKISHETVGKALGKTRQTVSRGLKEGGYLTEERLRLIANHLEREVGKEEAKKFRLAAASNESGLPAGPRAFGRTARFLTDNVRDQELVTAAPAAAAENEDEARPWTKAKELWIFTSRPRELSVHRFIEWMRDNYFDLATRKYPTSRLVYFCAPDRARRLGRYLLEVFEPIAQENRNRVIVLESRAISICPHYVLMDPLEKPEAWASGEGDYGDEGWIQLAQTNVDVILDNLKEAGIAGLADKFFAETFSADDNVSRNVPRFELRFDSWDLNKSRAQLAVPPSNRS